MSVAVDWADDEFDDRPGRTGQLLALVPAVLAVAAAGTGSSSLLVTTVAAVVLVLGVRVGSRAVATVAAIALFGGVLLAGVQGGSIVQVTAGAAATIVAWDAATYAIDVAGQLGADANATDLLLVHTATTTVFAALVGIGAVAIYWTSRGGEPTTAVALLLAAAVLFVLLLDR